jgi:hypothetical protein
MDKSMGNEILNAPGIIVLQNSEITGILFPSIREKTTRLNAITSAGIVSVNLDTSIKNGDKKAVSDMKEYLKIFVSQIKLKWRRFTPEYNNLPSNAIPMYLTRLISKDSRLLLFPFSVYIVEKETQNDKNFEKKYRYRLVVIDIKNCELVLDKEYATESGARVGFKRFLKKMDILRYFDFLLYNIGFEEQMVELTEIFREIFIESLQDILCFNDIHVKMQRMEVKS